MSYKLNLIIIKQGEGSDSELNEAGKLYAEEICNELIKKGCKFNIIYSSSSNCAKQTIEPYLAKREHNNVLYTEKLSERDPSTLDKDLLEALTTGHYNPKPGLDVEHISEMTLYDKNVEGNTVKRSWCEIDPETGKLVTKNIYNHDFPIERIDHFIVKVIHDHLIYPHDAYLGTSYDAYLGYPKDPSLKTQSVLIVTHSDYFKIISSMFMSTEFSRIETTDNMLNISLNHNWRLIIDNDFEHIPEYILYTELFSYIRINYMNVHYDSNDYIEPEFNIDDLKSDSIRGSERYIYGNYYRNGRKLNFWD